ncbi:MAG: flagellar biosynthesis anti-sigma factor FlgM [Halobacteriovoraceae bacterium]|nr:flagellar biosynthesis anti-sigma factor FlgM [Halobacteriovoraceae bacterium]
MSEIQGLPRPPFFPNSKSAQEAKEAREARQMKQMRRNSSERANELESLSRSHTKIDIPETVKDFSRIKNAVDNAPDIDNSEKVARLKSQIQKGEYQFDYDGLADKLLKSEY